MAWSLEHSAMRDDETLLAAKGLLERVVAPSIAQTQTTLTKAVGEYCAALQIDQAALEAGLAAAADSVSTTGSTRAQRAALHEGYAHQKLLLEDRRSNEARYHASLAPGSQPTSPPQLLGDALRAVAMAAEPGGSTATLDLLRGRLVRLRAPWVSPNHPLYSAALLESVEARGGQLCVRVKLLNESTRRQLGCPLWETSAHYISNEPLTAAELLDAPPSAPDVVGVELAATQLRALYLQPQCSELEEYWFAQRGGRPDRESDGTGTVHSQPGSRSFSTRLGELLGGRNLEPTLRSIAARSPAARAERVDAMGAAFAGWPEAERKLARGLGRWLFVEQCPDFRAYTEYVQLLRDSTTEANFARDDSGYYGVHRAFVEYAVRWIAEWREAELLTDLSADEELKCPVCFKPGADGFAGGAEWVLLQPCRHWLCEPCAQGLLDAGETRCPLRCGEVLSWDVASS